MWFEFKFYLNSNFDWIRNRKERENRNRKRKRKTPSRPDRKQPSPASNPAGPATLTAGTARVHSLPSTAQVSLPSPGLPRTRPASAPLGPVRPALRRAHPLTDRPHGSDPSSPQRSPAQRPRRPPEILAGFLPKPNPEITGAPPFKPPCDPPCTPSTPLAARNPSASPLRAPGGAESPRRR